MKRQVFLLVLALVLSSISTMAQKFTASFNNSSAKQAVTILKEATGYDYFYPKSLFDGSHLKVNGKYKDVSLDYLLRKTVVDQLGLEYTVIDKTVTLKKVSEKDRLIKKRVTGQVVDKSGEPLPGATVMVKGTTNGVATDIEGNFELNVEGRNPVLAINYVGMHPYEMRLKDYNGNPLHIELQPNDAILDEVIVTGYQELKKEKMTGAVTTISADKLSERYTSNLLDNLEGRVAGLSTYGGSMVIRGMGTLRASSSPLLVVDGVPIEGNIDDINPQDIKSINVLKDAAAAAIYGARAANGIIVITTKNAQKKGKIDVDFSANVTVYENRNVDYHDNFYMDPEEHIKAESDWYEYKFFVQDGMKNNPAMQLMYEDMFIQSGYMAPTPIEYAYYQLAKGVISRDQLDKTIDGLRGNNYARDFANAIYRRQVIQQYNLALRSSSDKARNNIVLNYKHDNSGIINHKNDWVNISYKGSYDLSSWLTATLSINSILNNVHRAGQDYSSRATSPWGHAPYMPFYNEDGTVKRQYDIQLSGSEYMSFGDAFHDLSSNPVEELYENTIESSRQNMRYHADLLFKIIPGLTLNTQFIYETDNFKSRWHATEKSHLSRLIRNAYTISDGNGGYKYLTPENGGYLRVNETSENSWTARGQLNYSKSFGKHDVTAIAGLEFRETNYKGTNALYLGYDDQLQTSNTVTVDLGTLSSMYNNPSFMGMLGGFPSMSQVFYQYISNSMSIVPEQHHRFGSGYFNATYTYDQKYNVFGSFRKDYADVFGLNSKFRGKPLWSIGAGWNIHNEAFMHGISWINFLKLRASYGVTGNIYQGATSVMTASTGKTNYYTHFPYATIKSPANPDLRWEQNRTTNIGLDFSLLDFRLRGTLDIYEKQGDDIFNNLNLDPTFGFTSMVANVASIKNTGVEASVSYEWLRPAAHNGFQWSTGITFTYNKNEVTDVDNDSQLSYQMLSNPYKVGYPVRALWGYKFAGISDQEGMQGTPIYYVENGATSTNPMTGGVDVLEFVGQRDPKYIIGLDNTFRWKGLSLGIMMSYYGGHKMFAQPFNEFSGAYSMPIASYFLNGWTPENPTDMPGIGKYGASSSGASASYSTQCAIDASFIKIRNITLSYSIPEKLTHRFGISQLSLRFQANNLKAIWTANGRGIDPETGGLNNPASYTFGINLNF